jgi:outer membrane lipoprotein carrier protein
MSLIRSRWVLAGLMALASSTAWAQDGLQLLGEFIRNVQSGRAQFSQTVTPPARQGQGPRAKTSSGTFEFVRPNRFRFDYSKPFQQALVADGQTLWLHDVDLNQVTARPLAQVLQGTPAAVIAAATDLRGLQADFRLSAQPEAGGLQWVLAEPRQREGQLQSIRVGLRAAPKGPELVSLDILDSFGQRSVMNFSQFETNPGLPAASFQFKPPPGADVIRP